MDQADKAGASGNGPALFGASLFGEFQLTAPDGREIPISNKRARPMIAMLCLAPD